MPSRNGKVSALPIAIIEAVYFTAMSCITYHWACNASGKNLTSNCAPVMCYHDTLKIWN